MDTKTKVSPLPRNFLIPVAWPNVLSDFLIDRELRGARPATLAYYRTEAQLFTRWAEAVGAQGLNDLTPDLLRAYFMTLSQRRSRTGVHTAWRSLKTWLTWAWEEFDQSGPCPMARVKVAPPTKEPKAGIPLGDIARLLEACAGTNAKRDRAILLFLLDTGIRRRELCALQVGDVRGDVINLRAEGTKVGKARLVFLEKDALKALRAYLVTRPDLALSAPLFATDDGAPLTVSGLRALIRRKCAAADVPPVGLHAFRRTFAIETLRASGDVVSTSRLLGHADVETTKQYLKQELEDLAEVHKRTSPVSKLLRRGKG